MIRPGYADRCWWIVSDLHLGLAQHDPRGGASAVTEFLRALVLPGGHHAALVLLGDTFELAGLPAGPAVTRLELLADAHADVFAALRECVRRGVQVHVVAGNHDVDLTRPAVAARLTSLLDDGGRSDGVVAVHPWALHVPGLLFAEHGHQHHAVHRLPTLLLLTSDNRADLPAPPLVAWHRRVSPPVRLMGTGRAVVSSRLAEGRALRDQHLALVDAASERLDLPPQVGRALWGQSRFRIAATVAVTATRMARHRRGHSPHDRVAPDHAPAVAALLGAHGFRVGWYVSGHTHRAGEQALPDGTTYLNTGTWSADVRGEGPDAHDPGSFPYVVVDDRSDEPSGRVAYWHHCGGPQADTRSTELARDASGTVPSVPRREPATSLEGCDRILVLGRTGSGKTTLARELAAAVGAPHVELDALYFAPDLTTVELPVLRRRTAEAISGNRWVTDGNKSSVRELVWPRADTIVWLDYPLAISLWRLAKRAVWRTRLVTTRASESPSGRSAPRQLLAAARGVLKALRSHKGQRRAYPVLFAAPENQHLAVVRLRSPRATRAWLERVTRA